jgi:bifunctional oligoribonuclease and PAP phosphatase NrnA
MLDTNQISELNHLLAEKKKIVITSHNNPDGDAIGSSLAMVHYLNKKGHDVTAIVPNHFPGFLAWLPGSDKILIYSQAAKKAQKVLQEAELIFCLDYNAISRLGPAAEIVERSTAKRIMIDHHVDPVENDFDYCFCTVNTSSTGELIYEFIELLGDLKLIDKPIAESIYTGIVTDTGSFSFAANKKRTYLITAELVDKGIDAEKVHRLIYDTFSEDRLRLLGHAVNNNMLVWDDLHTAIIFLTKKDLKKFNYKVGDVEGVVNYPLMMEKINMSVLLTERDNMIRMSMRSKGEFSVNLLARKHFNGGGHRNAAGAKSFVNMDETIEQIKKVLDGYRDELDYRISY